MSNESSEWDVFSQPSKKSADQFEISNENSEWDIFSSPSEQLTEQITTRIDIGIKPTRQVNGASDLLSNFDRCSNAGEQIGEFFRLAEQNPAVILGSAAEILKNHMRVEPRALAIRSIGKIRHQPTLTEITACQSYLSQDLLKLLLSSLQGKGDVDRDLIRWAASEAIENIGYSSNHLHHKDFDGLEEQPQWIIQEVIDRNLRTIDRVGRLNSRSEKTVEYKRFLQFWVYGPTTEIFKEQSRSTNYRAIVEDILVELQSLGVILGLGLKGSYKASDVAQDAAMLLAKHIYKQSTENEQVLYEHLESYLHDNKHEISRRIIAIELINSTSSWKSTDGRLNTLIKCLLYNEELRNVVVNLFRSQRGDIQKTSTNANTLLEALYFSYNLVQPDPMNMNLSTIDNYISSASSYRHTIGSIFDSAILAARKISSEYSYSDAVIIQFLITQKNSHIINIDTWSEKLYKQRKLTSEKYNLAASNQQILNKYITAAKKAYVIRSHSIATGLLNNILPVSLVTDNLTCYQYIQANTDATSSRDNFIGQLKKIIEFWSKAISNQSESVRIFSIAASILLILILCYINYFASLAIFCILCILGLFFSIGMVIYSFRAISMLTKIITRLREISRKISDEWRK